MFHTIRGIVCLTCVLAATPLFASTPTFKDRAHLFGSEAVAEAKGIVAEIQALYHKDVTVETYKSIPFYKDPLGKVKKMSPAEQDRFVLDWAKDRLSGRDAICVLIVDGPALKNVQVVAGRSLVAHQGFTADNCRAVRERLQTEMAAGHADAGLTSALQLVHVMLQDNLGEGGGSEPFDWLAWLAVVLFVGAVAITVYFVRKPKTEPAVKSSEGVLGQLLRLPAKPVVPDNGPVRSTHEPLKDWW